MSWILSAKVISATLYYGKAGVLSEFEKNNKKLEMCVNVFDKENKRLSNEFEEWQIERQKIWDELEHEKMIAKDKSNMVKQENEALQARIKEIEEELDLKNKAFRDLQKKYEVLEREYTILYK